jgi:hypothetical protein
LENLEIMRRLMALIGSAALAAGFFPHAMLFGQEKPKPEPEPEPEPEQYSAVWSVLGGGTSGPFSVDIRINRYNTDEDIRKFFDILKEGGQDGLQKALADENAGQLSTGGGAGTPIAIARKLVKHNQIFIRVVTARNLSFVGLHTGGTANYPFTFLDLSLNKNGNGTGTAIAAAGIRFDKENNTYVIKSLKPGKGYDKLVKVRRR